MGTPGRDELRPFANTMQGKPSGRAPFFGGAITRAMVHAASTPVMA
ncbi:MAG: hypothetical protein JNK48_15845 [Bryobacterales bacterium]|nr:hypothetical protein [Bryobacterales bacterium]